MNNANEMRKIIENYFPKKLKSLMHNANVKQEDLESYAGFGRGTVSNYIRGKSLPSLEGAWAIAKFFRITIDNLTGYNENGMTGMAAKEMPEISKAGLKELLDRVEQLSGELAIAKLKLSECEKKNS